MRAILAALMLSLMPLAAVAGELKLLMIESEWCEWCDLWNEEVGVIYDKTAEGKRAPLMRADIYEPLPDGITLARRANYTPTFVLLDDGTEIGRIEGYPGEDFFYGLLNQLLNRTRIQPNEGNSQDES